MKNCPICKKKIDSMFKSSNEEPFMHHDPMIGMTIYGPYSAEKKVLCHENGFLHFEFSDGENRLVQLGVTDAEGLVYQAEDYKDNEEIFDPDDLPF